MMPRNQSDKILILWMYNENFNPHTQIYPRINLNSNFEEPGRKPGFFII